MVKEEKEIKKGKQTRLREGLRDKERTEKSGGQWRRKGRLEEQSGGGRKCIKEVERIQLW